MNSRRSAFIRQYYITGTHPAHPGVVCIYRAWLTVSRTKQVVWVTRLAAAQGGSAAVADEVAKRMNMQLGQPTFAGVTNHSPLTEEQLTTLLHFRHILERDVQVIDGKVYRGKGRRRKAV